jgi:glycosyltransferase involved in cell wall biosynthesis
MRKTIYYMTDCVMDNKLAPSLHVRHVCENLVGLGYIVHLYAPKIDMAIKGVKCHEISTPTFARSLFFQVRALIILRNASNVDLIYARQSPLLFAHAVLASVKKIPLMLEVNGRLLEETAMMKRSIVKGLYKIGLCRKIVNFSLNKSQAIIVPAEGIKQNLIRAHGVSPRKVCVIANGVDTEVFKPYDMHSSRSKLSLKDYSYICFVGNLVVWQGLNYVMKAIAKLDNSTRLIIVGDGEARDDLVKEVVLLGIQDKVIFTGSLNNEKIPLYLSAVDICLYYPVRRRAESASPFKVYEYLACGKCVIAADLPGIKKEFGDLLSYAHAEDSNELARSISTTLNSNQSSKQKVLMRTNFVNNDHSWKDVAVRTSEIIEAIS